MAFFEASSLSFQFAAAVCTLLTVGVVSLDWHLCCPRRGCPRTQRNYLTTTSMIVIECRLMLESF